MRASGGGRRSWGGFHGDPQDKSGAAFGAVFHGDVAAVSFGHQFRDRQSQARALGLGVYGAGVSIENAREKLLGNPGSGVFHGEQDSVGGGFDAEGNAAAFGGEFHGVAKEVVQGAGEVLSIGVDSLGQFGALIRQIDLFFAGQIQGAFKSSSASC